MGTSNYTNEIVGSFDFSEPLALSVEERFSLSLEVARSRVQANRYQRFSEFPCVPSVGAAAGELQELERTLGIPLPTEYRAFLKVCRYLKIDDGCEVGGFSHNGIYTAEHPWLSDEHRPDVLYLVFANYWRFADGDQLMFDLSDSAHPVIAYLHEHGPLFEFYAPSFSLALWRLMHETD